MNLLYIFLAVLLLGFIVMAHEFGHYSVGRMLGIGIEEFSIGFGPKLLQWKRKDIAYSVRALPLGGYVRFLGEDAQSDNPKAMNNQKVWKRFLTVLAGPVMNFVLAYVATAVILLAFGVAYTVPKVQTIDATMPAAQSELQAGDKITAIDGTQIEYSTAGYYAMRELITSHDITQPAMLTVDRGGQLIDIPIPLTQTAEGSILLGITVGNEIRRMSLGEGLVGAGERIVYVTTQMVVGLRDMFSTGEGLDQTMGPVGIIGLVSENIREGLDMVIQLIIIISLNLGIMNLLPLPALDGGRLVFLAVEAIRRKPVNREREGMVHLIGLAALVLLILLITYKDIVRMVTG